MRLNQKEHCSRKEKKGSMLLISLIRVPPLPLLKVQKVAFQWHFFSSILAYTALLSWDCMHTVSKLIFPCPQHDQMLLIAENIFLIEEIRLRLLVTFQRIRFLVPPLVIPVRVAR